MRLKHVRDRIGRDFWGTYECEHCGATCDGNGYDDAHFHGAVIPARYCHVTKCGKNRAGKVQEHVEAIDLLRRYAEHHEAWKAENGTIDAEVDTFLRNAGVPL